MSEKIKIKSLVVKNFKNMSFLQTNINQDVQYLVGNNGAGKTTVIDAIWVALLGKTAMPKFDRFKMIKSGAEKAEITLTLVPENETEIIVKRTITPKDVYLKIWQEGNIARDLNQQFLNDILSEFSINPLRFARLKPEEQAIALGIDCRDIDERIKDADEERKDIARDLRRIEEETRALGQIEAVQPVDVSKLAEELTEKRRQNDRATSNQRMISIAKDDIDRCLKEIEKLKENIKELNAHIERLKGKTDMIDTSDIERQLAEASSVNIKAQKFQQYNDLHKKQKAIMTEHKTAVDKVQKLKDEKKQLIISKKFPFKNLTIDDDGKLLVDNKPLNENFFSTGEIYKIASKLINHINPELKTIFVQNASLIDEENLNVILSIEGYQFIVEITGEEKREKAIYLREMKKVNDIDEPEVEETQEELL